MAIFYFPLSFYTCMEFCKSKRCVIFHPFICLFNNFFISMWIHGYLFYYFGGNPILSLFCCSKCPSLGHWEHLEVISNIFLTYFISFINISLFSGTPWWVRLIFYFLCDSPGISFHFKEPWFTLRENGICRLQCGAPCSDCYWCQYF